MKTEMEVFLFDDWSYACVIDFTDKAADIAIGRGEYKRVVLHFPEIEHLLD